MDRAAKLSIEKSRSLNQSEWQEIIERLAREAFDVGVIKITGQIMKLTRESDAKDFINVGFLDKELKKAFAEVSLETDAAVAVNFNDHRLASLEAKVMELEKKINGC
ncbi:hypothetical protein [Caudoviricetes sp.]|nr:hypothetical protein [Caudoviricetes sp.]UOF82776.1 hypothetical protein [Caudoviricetes sp.]